MSISFQIVAKNMERFYILTESELGDLSVHVETDSLALARVCAEALSLRYHREDWVIYDGDGRPLERYNFGEVVRPSSGCASGEK